MLDRRSLIAGTAGLVAAAPALAQSRGARAALPVNRPSRGGAWRPEPRFAMGGTQVSSNHFETPLDQALGALQAAWDAGVRFYDTSPWYGLGLSERRFGAFFDGKPRDSYILSTKIGRVLTPDAAVAGTKVGNWAQVPPMRHSYDYTAEGTRRSIEQSLHRLGMSRLDIVFVHDLSPDNRDMGERWTEYFEQARTGAFRELSRMRSEGLIKAWGMGVNTIPPAVRSFQAGEPNTLLLATQYSLVKHEDALRQLLPVVERARASVMIGAPLNDGFLAGGDRFNYGPIPADMRDKRARLASLAQQHGTDLRTAALHFANAPQPVSAIIVGARSATQARQNAEAMGDRIPAAFWRDAKAQGLIARDAPVPA